MKYRTFRNLVLLGGGTALAVLWGSCIYLAHQRPGGVATGAATSRPAGGTTATGAPVANVAVGVANSQPQSPPSRAFGSNGSALPDQSQTGQRREDQLILKFLATRPATGDKVKDAFPGESFKVNFYRDGNDANWTRIKIDLDRDGRDDEKWDLEAGRPAKRRVATRDDEQYDVEYRWRGARWVVKN